MNRHAYHGGAFFDAIGKRFDSLENAGRVVSADVLDAWFDPSPRAIETLKQNLAFALRTSPPTQGEGLLETISEVRGIPLENLALGGGSSDLIFRFFLNTFSKNDRVMILDPMYGEYDHVLAHAIGITPLRHLLRKENGFAINGAALLEEIRLALPKAVVIVNPNSPTGRYWPKEEILTLRQGLPEGTLVIVDEAYIDYVGAEHSLEREVPRYPNLVVIKSMSKGYALSGARAAYLAAPETIIQKIATLTPPWVVGLPAQIAAVEALKDGAYYKGKYEETHAMRKEAMKALGDISSIRLYDSVANFFLIELLDQKKSASGITEKLREQGIYIRNCDSMSVQLGNRFVRIAVKRPDENRRILAALRPLLQ